MSGCRKGDYKMTTANNIKGQNINNDLITALYCRLSVEDIKDDKNNKRRNIDESNSISNQKQILSDYAKKHGYANTMFFVDDGISGTSFDRSDFNRMQRMVEEGKIGTIIVKDLSRFVVSILRVVALRKSYILRSALPLSPSTKMSIPLRAKVWK